jgi:hypothetical protein
MGPNVTASELYDRERRLTAAWRLKSALPIKY